MIDESPMTDATQLSPRAAIALLTLQLRSTVQEAIEAEAAADAIDVDGALWQLRSRLTPLIDERRRALDDDIVQERARAAEAIAAAHVEADAITQAAIEAAAARASAERAAAELARRDSEMQAIVDQTPPEAAVAELEAPLLEAPELEAPVVEEPVVEESTQVPLLAAPLLAAPLLADPVVELEVMETPIVEDASPELFDQAMFWGHEADELVEPADLVEEVGHRVDEVGDRVDEVAVSVPPPPPARPASGQLPGPDPDTLVQPTIDAMPVDDELWARTVERSDDGAMRVVLDADSFARAFAAAMAPILEAREQQAPQYALPPAAYLQPQPQSPPPKRSFWAHAWHPDVLLSGLAMVIVIIVLVAWTG